MAGNVARRIASAQVAIVVAEVEATEASSNADPAILPGEAPGLGILLAGRRRLPNRPLQAGEAATRGIIDGVANDIALAVSRQTKVRGGGHKTNDWGIVGKEAAVHGVVVPCNHASAGKVDHIVVAILDRSGGVPETKRLRGSEAATDYQQSYYQQT